MTARIYTDQSEGLGMRKAGMGLILCLGMAGAAAAEEVCFRTVGEAVRGVGVADGEGFRVEGVARDVVGGGVWARVRSCGHPERPVRVVRDEFVAAHLSDGEAVAKVGHGEVVDGEAVAKVGHREVVVRAGAVVRVVSVGEVVRMEVAGRAVEGGAMGARVRVRVLSEGEERFVVGLVRSADVLEMVR